MKNLIFTVLCILNFFSTHINAVTSGSEDSTILISSLNYVSPQNQVSFKDEKGEWIFYRSNANYCNGVQQITLNHRCDQILISTTDNFIPFTSEAVNLMENTCPFGCPQRAYVTVDRSHSVITLQSAGFRHCDPGIRVNYT